VFSDVEAFSVKLKSLLCQVFQELIAILEDCLSRIPDEAPLTTVAAHLEAELLVLVYLFVSLKAASAFFAVDD